MMKLFL
jgi:hypothetical protein